MYFFKEKVQNVKIIPVLRYSQNSINRLVKGGDYVGQSVSSNWEWETIMGWIDPDGNNKAKVGGHIHTHTHHKHTHTKKKKINKKKIKQKQYPPPLV